MRRLICPARAIAAPTSRDRPDKFASNPDGDRTAQDFEQDAHSPGAIEATEDAELFGEGTGGQANLRTDNEILVESQ
jgi:hypothetical protein